MMNRLYIDVHILQTVPPSCVNRDDTGSPKSAIYGGAVRARVSSQAWKKAVRDMFRSSYADMDMGVRTKRIKAMVIDELAKLGFSGDAENAAKTVLLATGLEEKSINAGKDAPLFFMSQAQANELAKLIMEDANPDKKSAQKAINSSPGIDVALFGRMVADQANLNIDASCQVAHAISTHKVLNEYDYFTAVDDLPDEDKTDAGAAMIGTVEYNSSTLYRYATVAAHELCCQLGNKSMAARAVRVFIDAFARSMPTGKINTFANRTLPDALYVAIRGNQPLNLAGAFERPIMANVSGNVSGYDSGYVEPSAMALVKSANEAVKWISKPLYSFTINELLKDIAGVEIIDTLDGLLSRLETEVEGALE